LSDFASQKILPTFPALFRNATSATDKRFTEWEIRLVILLQHGKGIHAGKCSYIFDLLPLWGCSGILLEVRPAGLTRECYVPLPCQQRIKRAQQYSRSGVGEAPRFGALSSLLGRYWFSVHEMLVLYANVCFWFSVHKMLVLYANVCFWFSVHKMLVLYANVCFWFSVHEMLVLYTNMRFWFFVHEMLVLYANVRF
jgi:hypothetical protein